MHEEGRPLPEATAIERQLLGCLLVDPIKLVIDHLDRIIGAGDFYVEEHGRLFNLIVEVTGQKPRPRFLDVLEAACAAADIDHYGGVREMYMMHRSAGGDQAHGGPGVSLTHKAHGGPGVSLTHMAEVIKDKAMLRELIKTARSLASRTYETYEDAAAAGGGTPDPDSDSDPPAFDVDFKTTDGGQVLLAIADLRDGDSVLVSLSPVAALEFANTLAKYALMANMRKGNPTSSDTRARLWRDGMRKVQNGGHASNEPNVAPDAEEAD